MLKAAGVPVLTLLTPLSTAGKLFALTLLAPILKIQAEVLDCANKDGQDGLTWEVMPDRRCFQGVHIAFLWVTVVCALLYIPQVWP